MIKKKKKGFTGISDLVSEINSIDDFIEGLHQHEKNNLLSNQIDSPHCDNKTADTSAFIPVGIISMILGIIALIFFQAFYLSSKKLANLKDNFVVADSNEIVHHVNDLGVLPSQNTVGLKNTPIDSSSEVNQHTFGTTIMLPSQSKDFSFQNQVHDENSNVKEDFLLKILTPVECKNELFKVTIKTEQANIRVSSVKKSDVLGIALQGNQFSVIEKEKDYFLIKTSEGNGFIHNSVVQISTKDNLEQKNIVENKNILNKKVIAIEDNNELFKVIIKTEQANIRVSAAKQSDVLGIALQGQKFSVLKKKNDYFLIKTSMGDGFIHKSVIQSLEKIDWSSSKLSNDQLDSRFSTVDEYYSELKYPLLNAINSDKKKFIVNVKVLEANIRKTPKKADNVLGVVQQGEQLSVIDVIGDYYLVSTSSGNAFIHNSTVQKNSNIENTK